MRAARASVTTPAAAITLTISLARVLCNVTSLKRVRPICLPADSDSSAGESGRASKSQSQD